MNDEFVEFPYEGIFYRTFIDDTKPLEEQVEEKKQVLASKCDIQEVSATENGNFINASFRVFIPMANFLPVKRGDLFEGSAYGMRVNGEIIGIYPSQLGGCTIYIKDRDI